jgi:hypothetical protein
LNPLNKPDKEKKKYGRMNYDLETQGGIDLEMQFYLLIEN